jgi:hypothetical protein
MHAIEHYLLFIRPLIALDVPFIVTGSVAAIVYGEPRYTHDVDIVVDLPDVAIPRLPTAFPSPEFYCPPEEVIVLENHRSIRGHFNVIHIETGFKADIYPVGRDSFHTWAFHRSRTIDLGGYRVPIAPAEYVIVRKLEFYREGGSDKHLRDIAAMLDVSASLVDMDVLVGLISTRQLQEAWAAVQRRMQK